MNVTPAKAGVVQLQIAQCAECTHADAVEHIHIGKSSERYRVLACLRLDRIQRLGTKDNNHEEQVLVWNPK